MVSFACRPALAGVFVCSALAFGAVEAAGAENMAIPVGGASNPPVGYVDFCNKFADQCSARGADVAEELTDQTWRDLQEVNVLVNRMVTPATDLEIYHRDEVWTLPSAYGDCEDYVLLKRKWLTERGWPTSALLVTVVFDEVGDGHAVLLARTSRGDFVLDNKTDRVRRWYETAYRFVKRQSTSDPRRWVSIGDPRWSTQATATSR
jgi:predicted transglutaminase-like cysteine proteinase